MFQPDLFVNAGIVIIRCDERSVPFDLREPRYPDAGAHAALDHKKKSPAPDKVMQFLDCVGLVHFSQMACVDLGRFRRVFPDVFRGRGDAMASFSTVSGLALR